MLRGANLLHYLKSKISALNACQGLDVLNSLKILRDKALALANLATELLYRSKMMFLHVLSQASVHLFDCIKAILVEGAANLTNLRAG